MQLRNILRMACIIIFVVTFVGFTFSFLNLPSTLLFCTLSGVLWVFEYILFEKNVIPTRSDFQLDLDYVRKLAESDKKQLPTQINSLVIAEGEIPDWIVVAGGASHNFQISFTSFQVVYQNKTAIIECPFNKGLYDKFCRFKLLGIKGKAFYNQNFDILQKALLKAEFIVVTHEHWDHVGGIAQSPDVNELMKKVILTSEQKSGPTINMANFPQEVLDEYIPLEYENYHLLSPGIVLIKAPGHSCGSQMIFVLLENGKEFLFVGDVAWNLVNIEQLKNHSKIGMLLRHENGRNLGHQLRWLFDNIWNNPNNLINIVTSHDLDQLEHYRGIGLVSDQFQLN